MVFSGLVVRRGVRERFGNLSKGKMAERSSRVESSSPNLFRTLLEVKRGQHPG